MANGEILMQLEKDIDTLLAKKRLSEEKRTEYRMWRTFVLFLKEDHERVADMAPKVATLWDQKLTEDQERKDNRKMILSPLVNILVTVGTTTVLNALIFYFTYKQVIDEAAKK